MPLPNPPRSYNPSVQAEINRTLNQRDQRTAKLDRDVTIDHDWRFIGNGRVILKSPDGTEWYLTVDNLGNVGATAV